MPDYKCERCGFLAGEKGNLKRHLNKKKTCSPFYNDIPIEKLLEKLYEKKSKKCKYCDKNFTRISSLKYHLNICKSKMISDKIETGLQEKDDKIRELERIIYSMDNVGRKDEFIYIIQEREFIRSGRNIYKIGKTINPKSRLSSYPNGSRVYMLQLVDDCTKTEKELIVLFDKKFEQCKNIGREYYKGEIKQMIKEFKKME